MRLNIDDHERIFRMANAPYLQKRAVQELHGIAFAVVYDGGVSDTEIGMLTEWLSAHSEFEDIWPMSDLFSVMERMLSDGVVSPKERLELLDFLVAIQADPNKLGQAPDIIFDPVDVEIHGNSFLFTGKLEFCLRRAAEAMVRERGGACAKSPRFDLDYLVVGDLGTDQWKYSRYGHKIEQAIQNRTDGGPTKIVQEYRFAKALVHPFGTLNDPYLK